MKSNALIEQLVDQLSGKRRLAELPIEHASCPRDARQEAELGVDGRNIAHAMGNSHVAPAQTSLLEVPSPGTDHPQRASRAAPDESARGGPISYSDADYADRRPPKDSTNVSRVGD